MISDGQVIQTVKNCISEGVTTKMNLVMEVAKLSNVSRRCALNVIEKYTGDDITKHHWNFTVKERGAKDYNLITRAQDKS